MVLVKSKYSSNATIDLQYDPQIRGLALAQLLCEYYANGQNAETKIRQLD